MNLELFERLVELLFAELGRGAQLFDWPRFFAERAKDLLQVVDGRIVAIEKEVVRPLVGIAVHQIGAARCAIAAGAANLLVVAFERAGRPAWITVRISALSMPMPKAMVATTTSSSPA